MMQSKYGCPLKCSMRVHGCLRGNCLPVYGRFLEDSMRAHAFLGTVSVLTVSFSGTVCVFTPSRELYACSRLPSWGMYTCSRSPSWGLYLCECMRVHCRLLGDVCVFTFVFLGTVCVFSVVLLKTLCAFTLDSALRAVFHTVLFHTLPHRAYCPRSLWRHRSKDSRKLSGAVHRCVCDLVFSSVDSSEKEYESRSKMLVRGVGFF
jgi:hypothetical protein